MKKEEDVYGFDKFFTEVKTGEKNRGGEKVKLGIMHAAAGSGVGSDISNRRRNVDFVASSNDAAKKGRSPSPKDSPKNNRSPQKRKRNESPKRRDSYSPKRRRSRSPGYYSRSERDRSRERYRRDRSPDRSRGRYRRD